ncbi:MAG: TolC family protein [Myxococcales bacterium]|jgi:cobalt-zinc-cadmium efflux system outer membrane protein
MIARSAVGLFITLLFGAATAHAELPISYSEALTRAKQRAPSVAVIRATEQVAEADSRVAGVYPNPSVSVGTNSDAARLALNASLPLVILGQRGAALAAGRAEYAVAKLDGLASLADVRATTAHAFVGLWLAERTARARADAARVSGRLEASVQSRVDVGSSPMLEGLRAHAERLRADLDARSAEAAVDAAATTLAVWIGAGFSDPVRALGDPGVPDRVPDLNELAGRVSKTPSVQRALAELRASQARASSERAQVRPLLSLDFGADFYDPTTPGVTNYHAQLGVEVPLFNQRGPMIEREERKALAARWQVRAEQARLIAELIAGFRTFGALTVQATTLADDVLPAAEKAASATEESYTLGRAPLVAVLDAERARIDSELALVESQGARANAWIDIERALGVQ